MNTLSVDAKNYRISGHESFSCRYTWLPKVVRGLKDNDRIFADEEQAIVDFGLGKNMVRGARFWAQASGVIRSCRGKYEVTQFGEGLFGEYELDPFLEDIKTLWLLHWNLSTDIDTPLLAWDFLMSRWQEPELVPSSVLKALKNEAEKNNSKFSDTTLKQHFSVFLHTYTPTRGKKGKILEDNLDSPLVELELIDKVGERGAGINSDDSESIYVFRREEKHDITPELFIYCLNDFWENRHPNEATLSFFEIAHGYGSPGQVFKIPEESIRMRLESVEDESDAIFSYIESAHLQQIQKNKKAESIKLLADIYS